MTDLYPSRCRQTPAILPRQEPVAWQDWHPQAPLNRKQYDSWCRDGFLVLENLFTASEVSLFQQELNRLRHDPAIRQHPEAITEPEHNQLRSLFRPQSHSPMYRALMADARLLDIVQFLLGSPVYSHQSRVNFKPGFRGREFYWHSDFETWHTEDGLPRMRTLSASITLTDNSTLNGPLLLVPGSQRHYISCVGETPREYYRHSLRQQTVGTPDEANISKLVEKGGIRAATGKAGTVTLFDCNTLHGSASNISPWPRSNLFFVYNSVENQPVKPFAGTDPRPDYIAERHDFTPLQAETPNYRDFIPRWPQTG